MRYSHLSRAVMRSGLPFIIGRTFSASTTSANSGHITNIIDAEIAETTPNSAYGTIASSGADAVWPGANSRKGRTFATLSSSGAVLLLCTILAAALFFVLCDEALAQTGKVEAETMTLSGSSVVVRPNAQASGGQEVGFLTNGSASGSFDGAATNLTLRARGTACLGNPHLKVYVDATLKDTVELASSTLTDYTVPLGDLSSGTHALRVSFENDYYAPLICDRNAFLDYHVLTLPDAPPPGSDDPVLVGAGKIAHCSSSGDEATARLLDDIRGTVFTAGDNAYDSGTAAEFQNCYEPTWGRHKARTRPTPGHHDYGTPGASGYFDYFAAAAGDVSEGYYSYDLGEWHIIGLNSACGNVLGGCGATSPMVTWLKQDLAANPRACTLAYFNHPLFSSGRHGNQPQVKPIWDVLYAAEAEVVINSRDHNYERFAPQDPGGAADPQGGIREFVVGTGGAGLYALGTIKPNSEVRNTDAYGVLKLILHPSSYDWQFVPVAGKTFTDSGTTSCHDTAPEVVSTAPQEEETGVALDANVEATFSEAIDPSTLNNTTFTLTKQGSAAPVEASVRYDESAKKATLNPASDLDSNSSYAATIGGGADSVKDLAGNPLKANVVWSFSTTDAAPPDTICTVVGSPGNDVLAGTLADDTICGLGGDDTLSGLEGNDTLKGGDGQDTLLGRAGDDALDGGPGSDTISFQYSPTGVDASLADRIAMGEGLDTLVAIENLRGSFFYDVLRGSSDNNLLWGLGTTDRIFGSGGSDEIWGGTSHDKLWGGGGDDWITGESGDDSIKGDAGDDSLNSRDDVEGNDIVDGWEGADTCITDLTEMSVVNCEQ